jgi:hypothetical protein
MTTFWPCFSKRLRVSASGLAIVGCCPSLYISANMCYSALIQKSTMGTVISLRHLECIEGMIKNWKSGAVLAGGKRMMDRSALDGFDLSKGSFPPRWS